MRTLLFAPETINIAETTRMIEIAKHLRGDFRCVFFGYADTFSALIEQEGFEFRRLQPWLTPKKVEHLWKVDRMESFADPFTDVELLQRVASERAVYAELRPAAVVIGFTLSVCLSARSAGVPLVYVMPFPLTRPFLSAGLAEWPDAFDFPLLNWIPKSARDRWTNRWLLGTKLWIGPFRRAARALNLPPPRTLVDLYEGDFNLVTDVPELTGVTDLPPNWQYVGPIYANLSGEVPPEIAALPRPLIYCAMGSSANRAVLKTVLESFAGTPYSVVAPVKAHLKAGTLRLPPNVHVYDWLPAPKVNPLADLAVIHGGQGTVQTACAAGTPFVGIGLQPEQEANIAAVERWGSALRLSKRRLTRAALLERVERLLGDSAARVRAGQLRDLLAGWDGAERAAEFVRKKFA